MRSGRCGSDTGSFVDGTEQYMGDAGRFMRHAWRLMRDRGRSMRNTGRYIQGYIQGYARMGDLEKKQEIRGDRRRRGDTGAPCEIEIDLGRYWEILDGRSRGGKYTEIGNVDAGKIQRDLWERQRDPWEIQSRTEKGKPVTKNTT